MKKGLLSLLAVTLTIVSCQNYDDQFAELTGLVNTLSADVAGLSQVEAKVTALNTTVSGLSTAIGLLPTTDSTADLSGLTTDLASAQTAIDNITLALADVSSAADLAVVTAALADVQEDVTTLLEADAVINQNVVINNSATLEYVNSLIGSTVDDPSVIVNGSVTINTTTFNPAITAAQLAEVNAIATKLATVLGAGATTDGVIVTSATPITFTNLSFIDDDYTVSGSDMDDAALRTVSGNLTVDHGGVAAELNYSQLASIAGDLIIDATDAATVTSVNLTNVVIGGDAKIGGGAAGVLNFPAATSIDLGSVSFVSLTAAKASSIVSGQEGTVATFTIDAQNGGTITINSLEAVTGNLQYTGAATTTFFTNDLATAGSVTVNSSGQSHFAGLTDGGIIAITADAAINLGALAETNGAVTLAAPALILTSLASVTHATGLGTPSSADLAALAVVTQALTFSPVSGSINLPLAAFSGSGLLSTTATTVTVLSSDDASLDNVAVASVDTLTVMGQAVSVSTAAAAANLVSLDIRTADTTGATIDLTVTTAATLLTTLNSTGFDVVTVGATGNGTAVVTMTTAGDSRNVVIIDNAALVSLDLNHTYNTVYTDAQLVNITNNDLLTAVDLTSVARLENADITGNAVLAAITAPGIGDLLTPGATVAFTIKANSLTGTYTNSVAAVADGINNSPYEQGAVHQPSLATWNTYATAVSALNTITFDIEYGGGNDTPDATAFTTATAADTARAGENTVMTGKVDTLAELQVFTATAN